MTVISPWYLIMCGELGESPSRARAMEEHAVVIDDLDALLRSLETEAGCDPVDFMEHRRILLVAERLDAELFRALAVPSPSTSAGRENPRTMPSSNPSTASSGPSA